MAAIDIYITDHTGKRHFNTNVTDEYSSGERRNLARHLEMIKMRHPAYAKVPVDPDTARIECDPPEPARRTIEDMLDDELLRELGA